MDNYYTDEIKDYNANYDLAVTKVDKIISTMENLRASFNGASGVDIIDIRNDIDELIEKLNTIKTTINNDKNSTNVKAQNCEKVYKEVKALPITPTFRSNNYVFESTGEKRVFIENGIIYWEESFRKIPISSYDGLFGGVAAVGKLLNSYPIIKSKVHADVDSMLKGVRKIISN